MIFKNSKSPEHHSNLFIQLTNTYYVALVMCQLLLGIQNTSLNRTDATTVVTDPFWWKEIDKKNTKHDK